jgi:hypothetical protein
LGGLHGQKSIWHAHGLSLHTPRQAVAPHGHATNLGLIAHGHAMAHTKACHDKPWHTQGMPWSWQPMGKPWHTPRHAKPWYMSWHPMAHSKACHGSPWLVMAPSLTSRCFRGQIDRDGWMGGGTNRSDTGLNLSGSWQQGHSATYNTPSRI